MSIRSVGITELTEGPFLVDLVISIYRVHLRCKLMIPYSAQTHEGQGEDRDGRIKWWIAIHFQGELLDILDFGHFWPSILDLC